jgi:2-polyprenyl-3-methyl-5-hydroxy-6-metoxy-1,4-benzoquinol methylase
MRDIGFNYYWDDPLSKNLFARGFESLNKEKYQVITAFEYLEHIDDPVQTFKRIFSRFSCEAIIFSTTLYNYPLNQNWWYFMFESGQHLTFYNRHTLQFIAKKLHLNFVTNGKNFHMFSKRKIHILQFLLFIYGHYVISLLPKLFMKSKTFGDHEVIKNGKLT